MIFDCLIQFSAAISDNPGLWTAGLVIRDVYCVLPSGEIVDGGGVIIQNMDIHFVAGNQTKFLRSMSAFDMYDRNGTILPIGASIAGLTAAVAGFFNVPAVTNTATLLSALMSLPVTETTFFKTNGNSVTTHVTEVCRALRFLTRADIIYLMRVRKLNISVKQWQRFKEAVMQLAGTGKGVLKLYSMRCTGRQ